MEKGGEICENVGKSEESVELDPQRVKSNTNGEDSDPQGLNQSANTNEEDPDAAGVLSTIYDFTVGMIWGDDGHNESQVLLQHDPHFCIPYFWQTYFVWRT
jgi:hypothetical protein